MSIKELEDELSWKDGGRVVGGDDDGLPTALYAMREIINTHFPINKVGRKQNVQAQFNESDFFRYSKHSDDGDKGKQVWNDMMKPTCKSMMKTVTSEADQKKKCPNWFLAEKARVALRELKEHNKWDDKAYPIETKDNTSAGLWYLQEKAKVYWGTRRQQEKKGGRIRRRKSRKKRKSRRKKRKSRRKKRKSRKRRRRRRR